MLIFIKSSPFTHDKTNLNYDNVNVFVFVESHDSYTFKIIIDRPKNLSRIIDTK